MPTTRSASAARLKRSIDEATEERKAGASGERNAPTFDFSALWMENCVSEASGSDARIGIATTQPDDVREVRVAPRRQRSARSVPPTPRPGRRPRGARRDEEEHHRRRSGRAQAAAFAGVRFERAAISRICWSDIDWPVFSARFSNISRIVRSMSIFGVETRTTTTIPASQRRSGSHQVGRRTSPANVSAGLVKVPTSAASGDEGRSPARPAPRERRRVRRRSRARPFLGRRRSPIVDREAGELDVP